MTKFDEAAVTQFVEGYEQWWLRFMADPWQWALKCVRTRNEDAAQGQQREDVPLPEWPHLKVFAWAYYACQFLEVDKSRQLMATWMACALAVHEAMFTEAANIGYQHVSIEDACDKLERYMLYILKHQPLEYMMPWVEEREHPPEAWVNLIADEFGLDMTPKDQPRPDQPPYYASPAYVLAKRLTNSYRTYSNSEGVGLVELSPFHSSSMRRIEVIATGIDGSKKWRGMTYTRAIQDEAWFHLKLADNVSSAKQTVGQNGRQLLISTAHPGEDGDGEPMRMIKRAPNQPAEFGDFGPVKVKPQQLPHGVELWKTQYGYTHLRIWYYAVPERRSPEWYERNIKTGNRRKNQKEQLISYDTPTGDPFYESYDPDRQAITYLPNPDSGLVIGMDGGRKPAALVCEVLPSGRVVAAFEVVTEKSSSVRALGDRLKAQLDMRYPFGWSHALVACDPTMEHTRGETNDETSAGVLREMGFNVLPAVQDPDYRFAVTDKYCLQNVVDEYGNKPKLVVNTALCPTFHTAMSGGCCTAPDADRSNRNAKAKNFHSHITEAGEYALTMIERGHGRETQGFIDLGSHKTRARQ